MNINRRLLIGALGAAIIAAAGLLAVRTEIAEAQQLQKLQACVKSCQAKKNQCFRSAAKSRCQQKFQSCVLQCQSLLRK